MANSVKPGDRVQVVGVYKTFGGRISAASSRLRTMLIACNVKQLSKDQEKLSVSDTDIREIKKLSKNKNLLKLLTDSLAPSIYGHSHLKMAVLLQLLGGVEKILANGAHLRGDINILLIGDPSTAKSQMLRYVLNVAPLAVATTGRGSTGVGLTAAVVQDKETGERTLEAGAMVFGDRGIVCIDEFDKMSDIDRVAIHEAMEQQTVTIAKGGIHTTLNARCSVLAAANPAYGHYMVDKPPHQNILLPDSLLSRFDLVFIILDSMDDESNRRISEHVLRMHRYISNSEEEFSLTRASNPSQQDVNVLQSDSPSQSEIYDKKNRYLYYDMHSEKRLQSFSGRGSAVMSRKTETAQLLSTNFLKKYIHYAKTRIKPVLTAEASEVISQGYAELRSAKEGAGEKSRTMPVTARTLETLIRIATALAKVRLSPKVDKSDANSALDLLRYSLFRETKTKSRRKKSRSTHNINCYTAHSSDEDLNGTPTHHDRAHSNDTNQGWSRINGNELTPSGSTGTDGVLVATSTNVVSSDSVRASLFRKLLYKARLVIETQDQTGTCGIERLTSLINSNTEASPPFSPQESLKILKDLSAQNLIWLQEESDAVIFV